MDRTVKRQKTGSGQIQSLSIQIEALVPHKALSVTMLMLPPTNSAYSATLRWNRSLHQRMHNIQHVRNRADVSSHHLSTEADPVSETLLFLVIQIPNDGESSETQ